MKSISKCPCGCYSTIQDRIERCGRAPYVKYCEGCPLEKQGVTEEFQCVKFQKIDAMMICSHTSRGSFCPNCTTGSYDHETRYVLAGGILHVGHPELPYQKVFEVNGCPSKKTLIPCEPVTFKSKKCRKFVGYASKTIFRCCDECMKLKEEPSNEDICICCEVSMIGRSDLFQEAQLCQGCGIEKTCLTCSSDFIEVIDSQDDNRCSKCHTENPNSFYCQGCERTLKFGAFEVPNHTLIVDNLCLFCSPNYSYYDVFLFPEMSHVTQILITLHKRYKKTTTLYDLAETICTGVDIFGSSLSKMKRLLANGCYYGKLISACRQNSNAASAILFTSWLPRDLCWKIIQLTI